MSNYATTTQCARGVDRSVSDPSLLLLGNFLSAVRGHRHYCEDLAEQLETRGVSVLRASSHPARLRKLLDMVRVIWSRRDDFTVAHVDLFSGPAFSWAEVVCFELARLGKRFVLTMHGGGLPQFAKRWPRRTRRLLTSAAAVTSPSRYLQKRMANVVAGVTVIPNGLATARYSFETRVAPRPRMIWIRAFHRLYNPLMAVDTLAQVSRTEPGTTLRMIGPDRGDGSLAAVRARARELAVEDRLEIVGPVGHDEIPTQLRMGDIFLNTTDSDNTPLSLLEAMASGLCVVSTSVGGIPFLLEHGRDALLVPPRDPAAMTDAVLRLLREPKAAASLSQAGRAVARQHDWSRVIGRWRELFARIEARS
jgi:glycosyltransferase involved in cell wall biosynthesis